MTQAAEWIGPVGDQWSAEWRRTDRSFAGLATQLDAAILAAAPEQGRAIDLGCGAGATSLALARARPAFDIVGADLSPALVARATERAGDQPNLRFEVGDAVAVARRRAPLDLLLSRHGVMFYDDPAASLTALHEAAAAGAPLVFSCFRAPSLNPWAAAVAAAITGQPPAPPVGYAPGPFAFADPAFVGDLLARGGWRGAAPQSVDFFYRAGEGPAAADDALDFFTRIGPAAPALRTLTGDARDAALDRLRAVITRHLVDDAVDFPRRGVDLDRAGMTDAEVQLAAMIDRFTPTIAIRVRACRAALRQRLPHAVELVYDNYNALAIGYAPRERALEGVVSLAIYPRNVLLYFLHGASLADPDGLLQGTGSRGRHVPFIGPETLADPRVEALLARAIDAMRWPFDPGTDGYTVIKSVSAKQRPRRPGGSA